VPGRPVNAPSTERLRSEAGTRPPSPAPVQRPALTAAPSESTPPTSVALRVSGSSWWESTAGSKGTSDPAAPGEAGSSEAIVDLSTYAGSTRVVQCPRCGGFRLDVRQQEPGFAFTCRTCGHPWQWSPGSAWPAGVVRPGCADGRTDSSRSTAGPA
jgi:hypothetical protein